MQRAVLVLALVLAWIFQACGDDDGNGGGPECNNELLEEGEQCDGAQLGDETCEGLGYLKGDLACTDQCIFDESGCSNCGNGTKDEGEQCDGQDLGNQTCRDLGYDGGDLACKDNCTFDGGDCYACGNSVIEMDEECDQEDLGGKTCKGEGHDGGDLKCTDNCTIDDSECYDCNGVDPCEGENCSGYGSCRVADCVPYCECVSGFVPGVDLTCLDENSCGQGGETCTGGEDCCMGMCTNFGGLESYCVEVDCQNDSDCINHGTDGRDMCCVWGPEAAYCMKPAAAGVSCGDHTGTCGAACAGALDSACAAGNVCRYRFEDDSAPLCGSECTIDADCGSCADASDPGAVFVCLEVEAGVSFCTKEDEACAHSVDCPTGEVCSLRLNQDQTAWEGVCLDHGGQAAGQECDWGWHSYDGRCTSLLCTTAIESNTGHCSEQCQADADCPTEMPCVLVDHCTSPECTSALPAPLCVWLEGSRQACTTNADCSANNEVCAYINAVGGVQTLCITPLADSPLCTLCDTDADCSGDAVCISSVAVPGEKYCGLPCPNGNECPQGFTCTDVGGTVNNCKPDSDTCIPG